MFRIQHLGSGLFFVNKRDSVCTIERHTTLFNNRDEFLGSLSMPFEHPLEPNRHIIENAHYILTSNGKRSFEVLCWFDSEPYKRAVYVFTIENGAIKATLFFDLGTIAGLIKSKSIALPIKYSDNLHVFGSDDELKAYMTETTTGTAATHPLVFFPFKNDGVYKDITGDAQAGYPDIKFPVSNIINRWEMTETGGEFAVDSFPTSQTQVPCFYLVYVLKRIWEQLGYKVIGEWCNQPSSQRIVIAGTIAVQVNIIPDFWYFMPEMSIAELFKEVRDAFGLFMDPDSTSKTVLIESISNLKRTAKTVDLRGSQLTGFRETGSTPAGYTISRTVDDKDEAFTDEEKAALPALTIGTTSLANPELQQVPLKSVATKMIVEAQPAKPGVTPVPTGQWRIPYMKQTMWVDVPLQQIALGQYADRNAFKLRFLFYHGMQYNDSGYLYPYGSADSLDMIGNQIDNYSLALNAPAGSFLEVRNFFNYTYNSRPFEMTFELTRQQLFNVMADKRILVKDFNAATVSCLLDQVSADLGNNPIVFAAITLYPDIITIGTGAGNLPDDPDTPPVDNGTVYVKIEQRNVEEVTFPFPPPGSRTLRGDLYAMFFADAAGTIPKNVTQLPVKYNQRQYVSPADSTTNIQYLKNCDGTEFLLMPNAPITYDDSHNFSAYAYTLLASAFYHIIT